MKKVIFLALAAGFMACASSTPPAHSLVEFRTLTPDKSIHAYGEPDTSYTEGSYTVLLYWGTRPDSTIGTPKIERTSDGLPFFIVPHPVGSEPDYRQLAFYGDKMYKGIPDKRDLQAFEDEHDSVRQARGHR